MAAGPEAAVAPPAFPAKENSLAPTYLGLHSTYGETDMVFASVAGQFVGSRFVRHLRCGGEVDEQFQFGVPIAGR
jgi:hypothetical protein